MNCFLSIISVYGGKMKHHMKIEYFTPEFDQFRVDVMKAGLKGVIVSKLMPFSPAVVAGFDRGSKPESEIDKADIVINVTSNQLPADIYGNTMEGTRFIKTMKYKILT